MTDEQAKNVLLDFCKERLNLVKLFRWNASMKHGVPIDDTSKMTVNSTENKPSIEASSVTSSTTENPFTKFIKAYAVITTFLIVLLSGLGLTYWLYNKPQANIINTVPVVEDKEDTAYQWLADKGQHIYK